MDAYGQLSDRLDLDKIKKLVCKELERDHERERCRDFYFNQQASVLKWKSTIEAAARNKPPVSFKDFVCIRELKLCCPAQSFGPNCSKCPRCSPNELCHGEGTRSGNGSCLCKPGHTGDGCNNCLPGFFKDETALKLPPDSSRRLLCKACHRSCQQCRAPGPMGCEVCRPGFTWQPGFGCSDVDECIESNNEICGQNTFCVNTEGAYFCYECDRACNGCHGDGPDMCLKCAKGYKADASGTCTAERKTILAPEANYYRYVVYAGLCLSICILLHDSVYLASLFGLAVALYIGLSEYIMSGQLAADSMAAKLSGANQAFSGLPAHLGL